MWMNVGTDGAIIHDPDCLKEPNVDFLTSETCLVSRSPSNDFWSPFKTMTVDTNFKIIKKCIKQSDIQQLFDTFLKSKKFNDQRTLGLLLPMFYEWFSGPLFWTFSITPVTPTIPLRTGEWRRDWRWWSLRCYPGSNLEPTRGTGWFTGSWPLYWTSKIL